MDTNTAEAPKDNEPQATEEDVITKATPLYRDKVVIFSVLAVILVGVLGIAFVIYNSTKGNFLTSEKQTELLKNVVANNPTDLLVDKEQIKVAKQIKASGSKVVPQIGDVIPNNQDNNVHNEKYVQDKLLNKNNLTEGEYLYIKSTTTVNNSAVNCYPFLRNNTDELYDHYAKGGFTSKDVKIEENKISEYWLNSYSPSAGKSSYLSYMGGDYAVNEQYSFDPYTPDYPTSYPYSYPYDQTVDIVSYFGIAGENLHVSGPSLVDGKNYYIVEDITKGISCDGTATPVNFVYRMYVNASNYQLERREYYIGQVKPENLLYRTDIQTQIKSSNLTEISKIYTFTETSNVKNLVDQGYEDYSENYVDSLVDFHKSQKVDFLKFMVNAVSYTYERAPLYNYVTPGRDYYRDRKFYRADAIGTKQYLEYVYYIPNEEDYAVYLSQTSQYADGDSAEIYTFASDVSDERILNTVGFNSYGQSLAANSQGDTQLRLVESEGTEFNVAAKYYDYNSSFPIAYPDSYMVTSYPVESYPVSYPYSYPGYDSVKCYQSYCSYKLRIHIFTLNGIKYALALTELNKVNPFTDGDQIWMKRLNYNQTSEMDELRDVLRLSVNAFD
jgi:hypothetical protein